MNDLIIEKKILVQQKEGQLANIYPLVATYESPYSLWTCAKRDGVVSEELYYEAMKCYGKEWHEIKE